MNGIACGLCPAALGPHTALECVGSYPACRTAEAYTARSFLAWCDTRNSRDWEQSDAERGFFPAWALVVVRFRLINKMLRRIDSLASRYRAVCCAGRRHASESCLEPKQSSWPYCRNGSLPRPPSSLKRCVAGTESAARKVEIEGFKMHHFLGARRALSDCQGAVGMAHVQRPESELPRSDPQFT